MKIRFMVRVCDTRYPDLPFESAFVTGTDTSPIDLIEKAGVQKVYEREGLSSPPPTYSGSIVTIVDSEGRRAGNFDVHIGKTWDVRLT